MKTKFSREDLLKFEKEYNNNVTEADKLAEKEITEWFKQNKYLNKKIFLKICYWKSKRTVNLYSDKINSDKRIREITSYALSSDDDLIKIKALQLLKGVSWPTASVILHFAFPEKYMIMDYRVIWSLGWEKPNTYSYEFWEKYTNDARTIAAKYKIALRTLDKALWRYSFENQPNN